MVMQCRAGMLDYASKQRVYNTKNKRLITVCVLQETLQGIFSV